MKYQGNCHCGAIKFSFEEDKITNGMRCNCSICARKGAAMSSFTKYKDELNIKVEDDNLALYQFDSKVAKHFFCKKCGIYPFHETIRYPGKYRVNLGCVKNIDTNNLDITIFDGKNLL